MEEKARGKEKWNVRRRRRRQRYWNSNVVSNGDCDFHVSLLFQYSLSNSNLPYSSPFYFYLKYIIVDRERFSDRESRDESEIDEVVFESWQE